MSSRCESTSVVNGIFAVELVPVILVAVIFLLATIVLAVYGAHMYVLLWLFHRRVRKKKLFHTKVLETFHDGHGDADWPVVTCQIPIYNEADVASRVIDAVAAIDYPRDRYEVQVLDDSTDRTTDIVDRAAMRWREKGVDVKVIRRVNREGYKAGALAAGVEQARGEFIAVFDADFIVPEDFLRRAIPPLVVQPDLACYQGRWGYLNREESWLTRAQALGLDGHFAIEQGARAWNGLMMNFNGTAGVWRKSAIVDPKVGGWHGDTLTEDMDLSYRAQLAGWKLDYCMDLACPSELPGNMAGLKSQQQRWATGSIQVARKLLPTIWRSSVSTGAKLEATFHLTNHCTAIWMLVLAVIAKPVAVVLIDGIRFPLWAQIAVIVVLLASFAPALTYAYARYCLEGRWSGLRTLPSMFVLGSGLCLSNSLAVLRGLFCDGGEFVRTPKSGSVADRARKSSYKAAQNHLWMLEIALGFYSLVSFWECFHTSHYLLSFFMLIYAFGFVVTGWLSRPKSATPPGSVGMPVRDLFGAPVPSIEPVSGS